MQTIFDDKVIWEQKYLRPGQSLLPNDSHFGNVESALKTQQRLYTTQEHINIMKTCRRKNKFIFSEIFREYFRIK